MRVSFENYQFKATGTKTPTKSEYIIAGKPFGEFLVNEQLAAIVEDGVVAVEVEWRDFFSPRVLATRRLTELEMVNFALGISESINYVMNQASLGDVRTANPLRTWEEESKDALFLARRTLRVIANRLAASPNAEVANNLGRRLNSL